MTRRALAGLLLSVLTSCAPHGGATAPDGREIVLPQEEESLPAGKALSRSFDLNEAADLELQYEVEDGKEIDIYFLTAEQEARGSAGHEPTEPGRDFITYNRGVVRAGNAINTVEPGRYAYVFRNRSDADVRVKTTVLGRRTGGK